MARHGAEHAAGSLLGAQMLQHDTHRLAVEVIGHAFGGCLPGLDVEQVQGALPQAQERVEASAAIDGHTHQQSQQAVAASVVLVEEQQHGIVEDVYVAETAFHRALTLVVQDVERQIPVLPSALQEAVTEVNILAIHEEALVEQPHVVDGLAPQHVERARDNLYAVGLVGIQIAHVIAAEDGTQGEETAQPAHLAEAGEGSGHAAPALGGE